MTVKTEEKGFKCLAVIIGTCEEERKSRAPPAPKLLRGSQSPLCKTLGAVEEIQELSVLQPSLAPKAQRRVKVELV